MTRKTISLDLDVYRAIRRKKVARESLSAALRRLLGDEKDPADYLEELRSRPVEVEIDLLRRRQQHPLRSRRTDRAV